MFRARPTFGTLKMKTFLKSQERDAKTSTNGHSTITVFKTIPFNIRYINTYNISRYINTHNINRYINIYNINRHIIFFNITIVSIIQQWRMVLIYDLNCN